jgi:hypothetical protein
MAELPRAAFLADRTVRAAAAMLPASARNRYEREFLSELFGLNSWQQTRYALDVLIHTVSLRIAIHERARSSELAMSKTPRRPLPCQLNVRHRWTIEITTDGGRHQRCFRCGKDRTEVDYSDHDTSAGAAKIGVVGFNGGGGF